MRNVNESEEPQGGGFGGFKSPINKDPKVWGGIAVVIIIAIALYLLTK